MKKKIIEKIKEILENNYIEDSPDLICELIKEELNKLIAEEILIANKEKQPTSRLTSLSNKIKRLP